MEKKKQTTQMSDMARINKMAVLGHGLVSGVLVLAYFVEVLKGARTIPYYAIFVAIALVPVIAEVMFYKKNPDSRFIKRVMAICYSALYIFAVFTSNSFLTFTYMIPMLVVITLYSNVSYCVRVGVGALLVNIADVIYEAVTVGIAKEELADVGIRIALVALVVVFVILTTRVTKQINAGKQDALEGEKNRIETLLKEIIRLSGDLSIGIEQVDKHMDILYRSSDEMGTAMAEVNAGTQETAESVQNQLARTEEIQNLIDNVSQVSKSIKDGMQTASVEVENGLHNMNELAVQAEKSKQANETVVTLMNELHNQTEKMNEIITVITTVANRTGMLALNASIEAARAGDAGKGFAVVATQVSDLSEQAKNAAVNITDLIKAVVNELKQVTEAVSVLEENTNQQGEKSVEVGKNLQTITAMTNQIAEKTQGMEKMISDLAVANSDIVQNIQTISAVTEEVMAHSNETMDTCHENRKIVKSVSDVSKQLSASALELKQAQEESSKIEGELE